MHMYYMYCENNARSLVHIFSMVSDKIQAISKYNIMRKFMKNYLFFNIICVMKV